ncbi:ThiF family adenylyltransferase [Pendulispora rubella]|uniref:ThiF family adenylyltransferase n=1 Tax=Pendulispora rubella TaxID=2741070 RepID=A0ABZ2L401_9BACT
MNTVSSVIQRPILQPTVIVAPLPNKRLMVHRGTKQSEPGLIFEDPASWKIETIGLLTGKNTQDDIHRTLTERGRSVNKAELLAFVEALADAAAVEDAEYFDMSSLRVDQTDRYSRNLNGFAALSPNHETPAALQRKLFGAHVLMLGCGGLGSCTATALTMAGCGTISLVDFDHIELGNLNRQLFNSGDVGQRKVDILKSRLEAINPDTRVNTVFQRLESTADVASLIEYFKPGIVVAAIDRPVIANDRWISDACFAAGIPAVFNSVSAGTGLVWTKVPGQTGCFKCDELWSVERNPDHYSTRVYREKNDLIPATSAFSHCAMTVSGMMASDIVRHLVGWPMASAGKLVVIDFATLTTKVVEKPQHPDCRTCK